MPVVLTLWLLLAASPALAGGDPFDPDQPFREALSRHFLESLLNQAAEAIEDHFEISGNLGSGDRQDARSLRFKFYPQGKSRSSQHFSAEGWLSPSQDSTQQEFNLRFALPKPSQSAPPLPDNVL